MQHSNDSYAAMLLTLPLTQHADNNIHPLSGAEMTALTEKLHFSTKKGAGQLMGLKLDDTMKLLGVDTDEAYRLRILLDRDTLMMQQLETCIDHNIDIVTPYDDSYPARLKQRLGNYGAPCLYFSGDLSLMTYPAAGIIGTPGIKTPDKAKEMIDVLIKEFSHNGCVTAVSAELGASRYAYRRAFEDPASWVISVFTGGMNEFISDKAHSKAICDMEELAICVGSPFAAPDPALAPSVNNLLYAQCRAVFFATSDLKRGETDALKKGKCEWMYAFDLPENKALIDKGFTPVSEITSAWVENRVKMWDQTQAEQLSFL